VLRVADGFVQDVVAGRDILNRYKRRGAVVGLPDVVESVS
jgi:hypothetical protein